MFGQAPQPSLQTGPGAETQPKSINDKDVEMLRPHLRANRKELMARNMDLTAAKQNPSAQNIRGSIVNTAFGTFRRTLTEVKFSDSSCKRGAPF